MTGRDQTLLDQGVVVAKLNRILIGWANYFCLGPVSKAYGSGQSRLQKATSVAVRQAQGGRAGISAIPAGIPAQRAGPRPP